LPPSAEPARKFMLVSEDQSNLNLVGAFTARTFINYAATANQGDFLMITHPALFNDGAGNNYVEQYRALQGFGGGWCL
jgi:hypothetical protein